MRRRANSAGSITKRLDGRWQVMISLPDGGRKCYYARNRKEAEAKLFEGRKTLSQGLPLSGERQRVAELLESWLGSASLRVRPRVLQRYGSIVCIHINPELGQVPLARLLPQHVERMLARVREKGASPRTAAHCRAVLRAALNYAMKLGLIGRNVASLATPPPVPRREVWPLSLPEARAILGAVSADRLEALFTVSLCLGLRQSEALGLRWADVDLEGAAMRVQRSLQRVNGAFQFFEPKSKTSRRTIPIPGPIVGALREHRIRQNEERLMAGPAWEGHTWGHLVFTNEVGGPLSGPSVTHRFQRLLGLAGLPRMRYHDLRHGAATIMAALGVPPRAAMEILGHAQIGTTMNIYAHIPQEIQREAVSKVAAALWPGR